MQVTCKICKKKLEKEDAYLHVHYTKTGNKQNQYFCSFDEWEADRKEKEYYKLCQYATDRILGEPCKDNTRNKRLVEVHNRGFTYEEIYLCISDLEKSLDYAITNKWGEFTNSYNKIAYIFGAINKEIVNYKSKHVKESKVEEVDSIEEYKGRRSVNNKKPSLMDIIRGKSNGK